MYVRQKLGALGFDRQCSGVKWCCGTGDRCLLALKGTACCLPQASQKGNFTARLAHSCVPSCKAVTLIAGGRLVIGIYTTRPIAEVPLLCSTDQSIFCLLSQLDQVHTASLCSLLQRFAPQSSVWRLKADCRGICNWSAMVDASFSEH